jgi:hypothetical protein
MAMPTSAAPAIATADQAIMPGGVMHPVVVADTKREGVADRPAAAGA